MSVSHVDPKNWLSYVANGPTIAGRFGKITSNNPLTVGPCTVAAEAADVVIGSTVDTAGDPIKATSKDDPLVECGATITTVAGKLAVTTDNVGRCVPAATGNKINGTALQDGVIGDKIRVRLDNIGKVAAP